MDKMVLKWSKPFGMDEMNSYIIGFLFLFFNFSLFNKTIWQGPIGFPWPDGNSPHAPPSRPCSGEDKGEDGDNNRRWKWGWWGPFPGPTPFLLHLYNVILLKILILIGKIGHLESHF